MSREQIIPHHPRTPVEIEPDMAIEGSRPYVVVRFTFTLYAIHPRTGRIIYPEDYTALYPAFKISLPDRKALIPELAPKVVTPEEYHNACSHITRTASGRDVDAALEQAYYRVPPYDADAESWVMTHEEVVTIVNGTATEARPQLPALDISGC